KVDRYAAPMSWPAKTTGLEYDGDATPVRVRSADRERPAPRVRFIRADTRLALATTRSWRPGRRAGGGRTGACHSVGKFPGSDSADLTSRRVLQAEAPPLPRVPANGGGGRRTRGSVDRPSVGGPSRRAGEDGPRG